MLKKLYTEPRVVYFGVMETTHTTTRTNTGDALATRRERQACGLMLKWRCPVCSRKINMSGCKVSQLQMDHLHAHNLGGSDNPGNLIPMCGQCNAAKNDHALSEGIVAALLASTSLTTVAGCRKRAERENLTSKLEWIAVAVGALLEEMRG